MNNKEHEIVSAMPPDVLKTLMAVLAEPKKTMGDDAHIPWWVKVFGSALVVIVFTVIAGAFQQVFSHLSDLNNVVRAHNERFVKYEDFNSRMSSQWNVVRELQTGQAKVISLEERFKVVEAQARRTEMDLKECRDDLAKLRERITVLEKARSEIKTQSP